MDIRRVYTEFVFRMNKLGTNANQNISYAQFIYLINKAQDHWIEQRIKVKEQNQVRQDELQQLLKTVKPALSKRGDYYYFKIPKDYYHYNRLFSKVTNCKSKVYGRFVEEGNLNMLLQDSMQRPSSAWEEVLVTLHGNEVRVYVYNFGIDDLEFSYYRCPVETDISGYLKYDGTNSTNINLEFDKVHAQEIIDLAVQIASGDVADPNRYQTITRHIQEHN